jgi:hypothetical protein
MRSDINGETILTNCSMRTRTQPFTWMTLLMTPIDALCIKSKNVRLEKHREGGGGGKTIGPDGIPIEVRRCFEDNYSMANQVVQPYLSFKQDD